MSLPKVFVIGFNKCGTRTLHYFFRNSGHKSINFDDGRLALSIFRNLINSRPLLEGYENFTVFADMECIDSTFAFEAYKLYPYFADQYPDAAFILNTRDVERWLQSRFAHSYGSYVERYKKILKIRNDGDLLSYWRADWHRHHENVEHYFGERRRRFLKFNIETDSPDAIAAFVPEYRLDSSKYKIHGRTADEPPLHERIATLGL